MFETLSGCITSIKYTHTAEILRQHAEGDDAHEYGHYEMVQDPISGAIIRKWIPADEATPGAGPEIIRASVRVPNANPRATESWAQEYANTNTLIMTFGRNVRLTEREQVTNIKGPDGQVMWTEINGEPTVFDITGVVPDLDPFGYVVEQKAVLERSQVQ